MELSKSELSLLQGAILELIVELDRVCRKNGIQYTLSGGTLIGGVREHGFIPWDDDGDVAMVRSEYERFVEACKRDLDHERFFLQDHNSDPEYPWGYSKLRMNGTRIIQPGQEKINCHKGIYLDVLIYDHVPDGFLARRVHYGICYAIRKCQYSIEGRYLAKNRFLRMWYSLINHIPKKMLFNMIEKMAAKYNKVDTRLSRHYTFPYFTRECKYGIPADVFSKFMDTEFEGKNFRIIQDYDRVLKMKYGDYMTPTPEKERKHLAIESIQFPDEGKKQ